MKVMKFQNKLNLLLIIIPVIAASACRKDDPESNFNTRDIIISPFHTITIQTSCELHLIQDTVCSLEIKGTERALKKFEANVENGELTISGRDHLQFLRPRDGNLQVYIHVNSLALVNAFESCKIVTENALIGGEIGIISKAQMLEADVEINCRVFYFWNNPVGVNMKLRGQTQELKLWDAGLSTIDARDVQSPYVTVSNGSQGHIYVSPGQYLDYSLRNIGNIYYYGNPQLFRNTVTGTGQLIQLQ
jgi:hypothetical protein